MAVDQRDDQDLQQEVVNVLMQTLIEDVYLFSTIVFIFIGFSRCFSS